MGHALQSLPVRLTLSLRRRCGFRPLLTASRRPCKWTRSGGPASVSVISVLYAVSRGNKIGLGTRAASLGAFGIRVCLFGYGLGHLHNLLCGPLADSYPAGRAKMIIRNRYPFVKAIWPLGERQFRRLMRPRHSLWCAVLRRLVIIRKGRANVKQIGRGDSCFDRAWVWWT